MRQLSPVFGSGKEVKGIHEAPKEPPGTFGSQEVSAHYKLRKHSHVQRHQTKVINRACKFFQNMPFQSVTVQLHLDWFSVSLVSVLEEFPMENKKRSFCSNMYGHLNCGPTKTGNSIFFLLSGGNSGTKGTRGNLTLKKSKKSHIALRFICSVNMFFFLWPTNTNCFPCDFNTGF